MRQLNSSPQRASIRCGLVGHGIGASLTPAMHIQEGKAQQLNYDYELFDLLHTTASLADVMAQAEAEGFTGLNITHPFKKTVVPLLNELDVTAHETGAVNTVVFRAGKKIGANTDYSGFKKALAHSLSDARFDEVLLLGAGGAGAAVALALVDHGASQVKIYDQKHDAAQRLCWHLSAQRPAVSIIPIAEILPADLKSLCGLVNATPVGMVNYPGQAFDATRLKPSVWVADIVYLPLETQLTAAARAHGCQVMPGSMLAIYQAIDSFSYFTGTSANASRVFATFHDLLAAQKETVNL